MSFTRLCAFAEKQAGLIRQQAGLGPLDQVDLGQVANAFNVELISIEQLELPPDLRSEISLISAREWSGGAQPLPGNRFGVILNPSQTKERAAVTLLEEIAHIHLQHRPTRLVSGQFGPVREYDLQAETDAYHTAAAVLVPSRVVAWAVRHGRSIGSIAAEYGASVEIVRMRVNMLGLSPLYQRVPAARKAG